MTAIMTLPRLGDPHIRVYQDSARIVRTGRLQNTRYFFMRDPMRALEEIEQLCLPLAHAFHAFGPHFRHTEPQRIWTEKELDTMREYRSTMLERYQEDYDHWAQWHDETYGIRSTGD
jgi:hypothetical protein